METNFIYENSSRGPVILFLHGFMGSSTDWLSIIDKVRKDYRVLAIDLPGHGKTIVKDDNYWKMCSFSSLAKDICQILDRLEITKAYLYGYSMGGRLALYLTIFYHERFYRAMIESASPGLITEKQRTTRLEKDKATSRSLIMSDYSDFLQSWYRQPIFADITRHENFPDLVRSMEGNDKYQLAKALISMSIARQPELWSRLSDIEIPLCLLTGELDKKFSSIAHRVTEINPSIVHKTIQGTGHKIHFENPRAIVKAIYSFFPL